MITARTISFKRGESTVFESLSFVVHAAQKVGVVGRNGVGKSTLFRFFRGGLEPDTGDLEFPASWRISRLDQEIDGGQTPAIEFVIDGNRELRHVERELSSLASDSNASGERLAALHAKFHDLGGHTAGADAATILDGLGFAAEEFQKPFNTFSGGWRIRLALARALMTPADLLLLDEPTNHLDMETTVWLEQFLQRFPGTLLVIAHDRQFLDHVCTHTLHLMQGTARVFRGGYSQFERARVEEAEREARLTDKRNTQIAHLEKFVSRFRAKASKARQVQSRLRTLEKLLDSEPARRDSPYRVDFPNPDKMSNPLLHLRGVQLGYGEHVVLSGISHSVLPGDRIGVLGANGAGKTTLLRCLVNQLEPMSGEFTRGDHSSTGYFSQHQMESLDASLTPLQQVILRAPVLTEQAARNLLGCWGFDGTMVDRPIITLSGGEKARLVLAMIAREAPAILVLDEPTNHLDIDMRDALSLALQDFEGALIVVSHDRNTLEAVCDEFWVVRDGAVLRNQMTIDEYLQDHLSRRPSSSDSADAPADSASRRTGRQERARERAEQQELRKRVKTLEKDLEKAGAELAALEKKLAHPEAYHSLPADELTELLRQAARARSRVETLENLWLEAAGELEAINE